MIECTDSLCSALRIVRSATFFRLSQLAQYFQFSPRWSLNLILGLWIRKRRHKMRHVFILLGVLRKTDKITTLGYKDFQ